MSEAVELNYLVIGAGVVGLAVARELAQHHQGVWLLEREADFGMGTSSRNSEVIHAGIYYPQDSLKARLCVRGKALLYDYCETHSVPYKRCGKLIVASNQAQLAELESIALRAQANGVDDLRFLNQAQVLAIEPGLNACGALHSPSTGIIDSHQYMTQLLADFERFGGQLVCHSELKALAVDQHDFRFKLMADGSQLRARHCVNAAGLYAPLLFKGVPGFEQALLPKAYYAKGDYFSYAGAVPFKHLIYPVPEPGGLGVHLTLDMAGQAKFGPDVTWLRPVEGESTVHPDDIDYQVDAEKRDKFSSAVRQYWPAMDAAKLQAAYSGVRPKISGPGEAAADFVLQDETAHQLAGLVNLFGIESPGLTSSLAIAEAVNQLLHA